MSFEQLILAASMSPRSTLTIGAASLACLATLDALTSPRLPFSILLLLPVAWVAWNLGQRAGLAAAALAAAVRLLANVSWHGAGGVTVWDGLLWTATFAGIAQAGAWVSARAEESRTLTSRVHELVQIEHGFARTDPLTALCNRRAFVDELQRAEARSRRSGGGLAVVRLDLDGFGAVNHVYSRGDGDQLLRTVATSLTLTMRMGDLAARLDGDEFALLLYGCTPDHVQRVGERIVEEIADLGRAFPEARVTASVGIAAFAAAGPDPDEMMRLAGAALRRARMSGGNTAKVEDEWTPAQIRELGPATQPPPAAI